MSGFELIVCVKFLSDQLYAPSGAARGVDAVYVCSGRPRQTHANSLVELPVPEPRPQLPWGVVRVNCCDEVVGV